MPSKTETSLYDTNLLAETLKVLEENDVEPSEVEWVGGPGWCCSWERFASEADCWYDSDYGVTELKKIVVVGANWWLERHQYDGSEWWEFKELPVKQPETPIPNGKLPIWERG